MRAGALGSGSASLQKFPRQSDWTRAVKCAVYMVSEGLLVPWQRCAARPHGVFEHSSPLERGVKTLLILAAAPASTDTPTYPRPALHL